jgi:uncharacterized protein (TIGR03435 family)
MRIAALSLASFACFYLRAQLPVPGPVFDVASVRLAGATADAHPIEMAPGSLTIRGQSLRACMKWAYNMPRLQITGPDWVDDVRLNIAAKAAGPADETQLRLMLRALLADRMGVKAHIERKEMPIYALTLTEGGTKLRESTTEGPPSPWRRSEGVLAVARVSMAEFAEQMSEPLNRPVVDATGLTSRYDIRIDVSPYMLTAANAGKGEGQFDVVSILFTALPDQLGLKLNSRRATVDVLVIDQAARAPTEN